VCSRGGGRDRPEAACPPGSRAADGEAGGFNAVQKLLTTPVGSHCRPSRPAWMADAVQPVYFPCLQTRGSIGVRRRWGPAQCNWWAARSTGSVSSLPCLSGVRASSSRSLVAPEIRACISCSRAQGLRVRPGGSARMCAGCHSLSHSGVPSSTCGRAEPEGLQLGPSTGGQRLRSFLA
jgi:hypothetical protein